MPFPRKFRRLVEIELPDVEAPDYVWVVYAVCAVTPQGCGWGGWMLEGAFKLGDGLTTDNRVTTRWGDTILPSMDAQICPRCGGETFRTGADLRMEPSNNQKRDSVPGRDYHVLPIEYDD
jgi:hypothetical protein